MEWTPIMMRRKWKWDQERWLADYQRRERSKERILWDARKGGKGLVLWDVALKRKSREVRLEHQEDGNHDCSERERRRWKALRHIERVLLAEHLKPDGLMLERR